MIILSTSHPLAYDSPDHLVPHGTKNDNYTSSEFIKEAETYFNTIALNVLDLGCAGGQMVVDFFKPLYINSVVGLEGSDYNIKHHHPNWVKYHNELLFTCDITKPFDLYKYYPVPRQVTELAKFNLVTAWEFIEHISIDDLPQVFKNVDKHMHSADLELVPRPIMVGTISTVPDVVNGTSYHQSIYPREVWVNELLTKKGLLKGTGLELVDYPFTSAVREASTVQNSFRFALEKTG